MQVVHTAALPPNQGRMYFAISGCTRKSRKALQKMVIPNGSMEGRGRRARPCYAAAARLATPVSMDDNILRRLALYPAKQRPLVPELHLGTHWSAKLHLASRGKATSQARERDVARGAADIPRCRRHLHRRSVLP